MQPEPPTQREVHLAGKRVEATYKQPQQTCLAGAVRAYERQPLAVTDFEADVLKQQRCARVAKADVVEPQHAPTTRRRSAEVQIDWPAQLRPLDAFVRLHQTLQFLRPRYRQRGLLASQLS